MLDLTLIRHGETVFNATGRIQGQLDAKLSPQGVSQAQALAKRIGGWSFDQVCSSDLSRASDTARQVFPEAELRLDPRLREMDLGHLQGGYWDRLEELDRRALRAWLNNDLEVRIGGGESMNDLLARARQWLETLEKNSRVVAFTHGGFIRAVLMNAFGLESGARFTIDNTSISRLHWSGNHVTMLKLNDTAHLENRL
ncbi:MAG: hypothetical protein AUK47_09530 [Deltaproteobacteria bacterium CG2_30_63_29]|nr:MAG: hypothetical protein AUK47_09530 [Deltaproteobacteria bacterium CG2_30_63_29]